MELAYLMTWANPNDKKADWELKTLVKRLDRAVSPGYARALYTHIDSNDSNPAEDWITIEVWANPPYKNENHYGQLFERIRDSMYGYVSVQTDSIQRDTHKMGREEAID